MYFHKPQEPPPLWGSPQDRQYAIWRNMEDIYRCDHESEVLIIPGFWGLPCLDYSGYNNHGTNHGATYKDGSLDFDGGDDYMGVADTTELDPNDGSFSAFARIKTSNTTDQMWIFDKGKATVTPGPDGEGWALYLRASNPYMRGFISDGSSYTDMPSIDVNLRDNVEHSVGMVWNNIDEKITHYADGNAYDTADGSNIGTIETVQDFLVGRYYNNGSLSSGFDGSIFEVRVSSVTRTSDQIALFNDNKYGLYQPVGRPIWSIPAAPPIGAIMNQFQGANLGADLFNGTLL